MELSLDEKVCEAEMALLGSVLISPELAGEMLSTVKAGDLFDKRNRTVFDSIRELYLEGKSLDPVAIVSRLPPWGARYVAGLMQRTPTAQNFRIYLNLTKEAAQLRCLQTLAMDVIHADSLEQAKTVLSGMDRAMLRPKIRKISYAEGMVNFCERATKTPDYLDWGLAPMNRNLQIGRGKFVIIGADSSVGKTALSLQLAVNIARKGKRVGFFSLETDEVSCFDRVVSCQLGIDFSQVRARKLNEYFIEKVGAEAAVNTALPFDLLEAGGCSVEDIRACCLADRYDVIFVDYVQLLTAKGANRWEIVTNISMELHTLAQSLGVTVIGLSQITPPTGKTQITKDDLRESRQLKQDADAILLMERGEAPNERRLTVDKNKDGKRGTVRLLFDGEHMRFTDAREADPKPPKKTQVDGQRGMLGEVDDDEPIPF